MTRTKATEATLNGLKDVMQVLRHDCKDVTNAKKGYQDSN